MNIKLYACGISIVRGFWEYMKQMSTIFLACMASATAFYHLPPRLLPVIEHIEGGTVGGVVHNSDGSTDLGLMQINTRWIEPLAKITQMTPSQIEQRLSGDACFNIAAAAYILRTYLMETHGDIMKAVGDYHSHTASLNHAYQLKALDAARMMFHD